MASGHKRSARTARPSVSRSSWPHTMPRKLQSGARVLRFVPVVKERHKVAKIKVCAEVDERLFARLSVPVT